MNNVFISYAHEDIETAVKLYDDLQKNNISVWLDKKTLLPGQKWKDEIEKAIQQSKYFIALISQYSVGKRGYVQKEFSAALEVLETIPPDNIFLIPVRLDESKPNHPKLNELHWLDLFDSYDDGLKIILKAVKAEKEIDIVMPKQGIKEIQAKNSLSGQWRDPSDGDVSYFKEINSKIIGFYDFATKRKTGIYIGKLVGNTFEYSWRWLSKNISGNGVMVISDDGKNINGRWWYDDDKKNIEHVGYEFVSYEMPKWLSPIDFKKYL